MLTSRDVARPDVRLRTRFGTPASPSIEHRSTAAAAPRLGRSSKLTPLACSECIAAAADGRSSRRVVRRTSCPRCCRAAAQLKFLGEARWRRTRSSSPCGASQGSAVPSWARQNLRSVGRVEGARWIYRGLRLACCGCATSTPPAVAAHTISAAARRRSVGSDGGPHLWNDSEWPMATTTSAARERCVQSLHECAPDHCVRTPSPAWLDPSSAPSL